MNTNLNTAILKNSLHRFIVELDDEETLLRLQAFANTLVDTKNDWWDNLTDNEISLINKGIEQLDKGMGIPNSEVIRKADQILGK